MEGDWFQNFIQQLSMLRLIYRSRFPGTTNGHFTTRNNLLKYRVQASGENLGSGSEHIEQNEKPLYHPFEDITESTSQESGDARLTAAETTRTIVEVLIEYITPLEGMTLNSTFVSEGLLYFDKSMCPQIVVTVHGE